MLDFEKFESLDADKQAEVFRQSTIKEKGELLIRSHEPSFLVRGLSQEELYLIAREMDQEERSEILKYADFFQLSFFSDIECWSKDRLNPKGFMTWLETLQLADDAKLLEWLIYSDYELVVTGLKQMIQVIKAEREYATDELLGDTPYFTLDENYFIAVREENLETVRRVFEILFENHRGRYVAVLEGILSEVEEQLEEEAYFNRERRLAERGFPSPESAHSIFKTITEKEFEEFPLKECAVNRSDVLVSEQSDPHAVPNYLVLWNYERLFLDEILDRLAAQDPLKFYQLREELAWLANKVIACEGIDFSSEERVRRGIGRARSFVNLGFEILCGQDLSVAVKVAGERWLEIVFRRGATELNLLHAESLKLVRTFWNGSKEDCLNFLDSPYDYILRGFLKAVPDFYEPHPKEEFLFRDFTRLKDLDRARRALAQLWSIHEVFEKKIPGVLNEAREIQKIHEEFAPSLFTLIAQCFACFVLERPWSVQALKVKDLTRFVRTACAHHLKHWNIRPEMKEDFLRSFFTEEEREILMPLWSLAFGQLQDELAGFDPEKPKDQMRYIRRLIINQKTR